MGCPGCGKSTAMIAEIQKCVQDGEHVVTIVPEQFSYEFDRNLYRALGSSAFNQVQTMSFKSLARELFQQYGFVPDGKTNADATTKMILLYQAVLYTSERERSLVLLQKQCKQMAFLQELSDLFTQFRKSGIAPESLYQTCGALSGRLQIKTMDLFRIYQKYDQLLQQHHLKDTETELTEAAAIANGQDAFLGDIVYLDEFDGFTQDEYEMLRVLMSSAKETIITFRTDGEEPTPFSLFRSVNETWMQTKRIAEELHIPVTVEQFPTPYRFQSRELEWLSQHAFRSAKPYLDRAENLHILEAATPNEEVDFVCATIRRQLQKDPSLRCRDIVVLTNALSDYQSILEIAMQRYELPYHLDKKQSLRYTPLLVYLHTLLELLKAKKPDTELLLRLGKTGLTDCSNTEISKLENYCYTWKIDGNTWNTPFTGGACEAVENIRKKLLLPLETLKRKCSEKQTGVSFCKVLYQFFMEQQVEKRLSRQLLSIEDMQKRMEQQKEWIFVWNTVMEMLDHIASLYETVELEFSAFSTILSFLICSIERAVPPKTLDAILISDGTSARLNAPKIVFLLGVRDGAFPITPSGSGIFSQRDCSALAALNLSVVKPKEAALADARLDAYKLLSAASQQLYLIYPVVDVSHQKCYPSAVLTQIQRMFPNENSLKQNAKALGCAYYAGTLHAAYYQYVQNFGENTEDTASIESFLQENDFYAKRLQALKSFTGGQNASESEPIYQISNPNLMTEYLGDTLNFSASALERYQKCPFSYFCHDILRLRQRQHIQLSGASGGSLIHYCLEKLLKAYDKESFLQLSETVLFRKVSSYAQEYWNEFMGGNFSKSNRELAIFRHTIQDMLPMLLHLQEELRQSCFVPYQVELVIEPGKADFPPLELFTNEGQRIQMCGKIDRVDLCRDGEKTWVRIIDYKSGEKTFSLGNLQYGLDMQMLIYLFSITAENAALSDAIPAGVLYLPSGKIKKDIKREDKITMTKHWNDTYRMNGLLVKDPALIPLMEREGSGIYIPGMLDENGQIKEDGATFLSLTQMKYLREYVLTQLKHTAEEIYHGTIDAFPLEFENQLCCTYCDYRNVCGSDFCHKRVTEGTKKDRNKRVFETLEQMRQKEENADGVDTTTTGCH